MSQVGGIGIDTVQEYLDDIQERFSKATWFGHARIDHDDGGAYIEIRATSRKDAFDGGFLETDYPKVKFCFYSLVV